MKLVDQTRFGKPDGNCMAATLASILEIPIETVDPHVINNSKWVNNLNKWLQEEYGLALVNTKHINFGYKGYLLLAGETPRGLLHSCVGQIVEGIFTVVHDPHPSRAGLIEITEVSVLAWTGIKPSKALY